jgi:hypothetical protein
MTPGGRPTATVQGMPSLDVRTSVEAHLGSRQVSRVVYGSIIGVALVVALQSHPPPAAVMIGWLLGTGVAVGLAELYSEVVGEETSTRKRVTRPRLRQMAGDAAVVAFGIAFPVVFFLFPLAGIGTVEGAFTAAKWSGLGLVGFYGFWAARFAGARWLRAVLYAAAVASVDALLIALKAFLH